MRVFERGVGETGSCGVTAATSVLGLSDLRRGHLVPTAGRERFRFNVWLNNAAPLGTGVTEVIISDFSFIPLAERHR